MPYFEPVNDKFIALDGTACYVNVATSMSQNGRNKVEYIIDVQFDALGSSNPLIARANAIGPSLDVDSAGKVSFTVPRNSVNYIAASANGAIVPGKRYIIRGVDDGASVKLYINGTVQPTTATPTALAITVGLTDTLIGKSSGGSFSKIRIFGAQVRQDGIVTIRILPRATSGTTLHDISGFNQTVTLAGTTVEGTNFYWGTAWNREPMFAGGVTL